ncbi:glycosyltransferase family 4 protein [Pseudoalteromonas haloplanktis]|uniref:Glycosyltransferase family 4 protein n=1 Tax=Pseudoalteromonas haloplanktis TaxID=228 RepID=A0ABU1BI68_PSEHA|nr:glycosyltransferase family 4 protein [Pseudoalteromonas haloplanktis]MDQ9094136.1 glycosyltransferase family 4 protein [Pseudoalteromonas haloplanktis]
MNKKILLCNTSFYPQVGGVENSLRSLSEEFCKQGNDVTIIASDEKKLPKYEKLFNAEIYRYKCLPFFGYIISIAVLLIKLKPSSFDIIVSRHFITTFVLLLLGAQNVKYIVPGVYKYQNAGVNGSFFGKVKYFINSKIEAFVLNNAEDVYVFSDTMEAQVKELRNKDITRLYPGVSSDRFFPVAKNEKEKLKVERGIPLNKKIVFSIGRFVDVKNFRLAIESLKELDENYILVLVGDGPLNNELKMQADSLGIQNRVFFQGITNTPEIFFKLADVFLLTSTYEPFGQVLLEATASKLPVVAIDSDIKGIKTATKEIYKTFNNLVCLSVSAKAIDYADAIRRASDLNINENQFESFLAQYSWSKMALYIVE